MASPRKRKLRKLARIKKAQATPGAPAVDTTPPPLPPADSGKQDTKAPEKAKKDAPKKSDAKTKG